jgi:hypothetical protein
MAEQHEIKEYSDDLQKLFLEFLIGNGELASRCQGILEADYFSRRLNPAADFIKKYVDQHSMVPTAEQVNATCGTNLQQIDPTANVHADWFLGEFEQFCRYKALEKAILKSADMLEKQQYGGVEKLIREATQIGLAKSFGTDYYADPRARLGILKDANGQVSTGWKTVDEKLYGGFNRGELNIFAGGSGAGKSLFLQNIALNWSLQGYNVIYFSLELSEGLTSLRLDSMVTGMPTKEVFRNIDDVELKVKMAGKKAGALQVVQLPNGITINDLRAWLKEFQVQTGKKVDAIIVDYLDLMMPAGQKISVADLFIKDKLVSEELRNLSIQLNLLLVTASQLNRSAVETVEFDHSHIAGGLSKIQTADNVFGIFSSIVLRERGRVQIQFMKTRSSSAVGQKMELAFNVQSLRISDMDPDADDGPSDADVLYKRLQTQQHGQEKSVPGVASDAAVVKRVASAEQLRAMLRKTPQVPESSPAKWEKATGTPAWEKPPQGQS